MTEEAFRKAENLRAQIIYDRADIESLEEMRSQDHFTISVSSSGGLRLRNDSDPQFVQWYGKDRLIDDLIALRRKRLEENEKAYAEL